MGCITASACLLVVLLSFVFSQQDATTETTVMSTDGTTSTTVTVEDETTFVTRLETTINVPARKEEKSEAGESMYAESTTPADGSTSDSEDGDTVHRTPAPAFDEDICGCDLKVNSCDVNCCCDPDCSPSDRSVFSHCMSRPSITPDYRYCVTQHVMAWNNTEHTMVRSNNGLLCIARDNLQERFVFEDIQPIDDPKALELTQQKSRWFHWPDVEVAVVDVEAAYKAGGPVIAYSTELGYHHLRVPGAVLSGDCSDANEARFMMDSVESCLWPVEVVEETCSYYKKIWGARRWITDLSVAKVILQDLAGLNLTKGIGLKNTDDLKSILNMDLISVLPMFCESEEMDKMSCEETSAIPPITWNSSSVSCENIMSNLEYKIVHNGSHGIENVTAYFTLISIPQKDRFVCQKFQVSYNWISDKDPVFYRSGNPGYVVGAPILAGKRKTLKGKEFISVDPKRDDWFALLSSCEKDHNNSYEPVGFGQDMLSACSLQVTESNLTTGCHLLQLWIYRALTANIPEYVALYGNAQVENLGDWIKVLGPERLFQDDIEGSPKKCETLVTSVSVKIAYSLVGTLANPQAKVVGVAYELGNPRHVLRKTRNLELRSVVSFMDVSTPALPDFARPPTLYLGLPSDFFYPLFSASPKQAPYLQITIFMLMFNACFYTLCK